MRVKEILEKKSDQVVTIDPETTIARVVSTMAYQDIGAIVVVDASDNVLGLLTERDIVRGGAKHHSDVYNLRVKDLMLREILTCKPDDYLKDIIRMMMSRRARHVPVLIRNKLVGILTTADVVKNQLKESELEVGMLRDYALSH